MNSKLTARGSIPLDHAWTYSEETYGTLKSAPVIAGDRLICLTTGNVFALDIYSGEVVTVADDEDSENPGFPYRRRASADKPVFAHSRGILYFVDGGELIARQL